MATPRWNKSRCLWVIQGQKNGIKKTFYSSIAGRKGMNEVLDKYNDWVEFGGVDQKITVAKCVELYLADIESRLGKTDSYKTAEQYTRLYVLPTLGKAKMNNLSLRDWQAVINEAKPHTEHVKTFSKKTLMNLRSVIVGLHRFAYMNYYCDDWRGTLYIPQGHAIKGKEILQPHQIAELFKESELFYAPCFQVMLLCGLRPSECLGIQEQDIKQGVLEITRGISDDGRITACKNKNARRIVPLPEMAKQIIETTIQRNHDAGFNTPWVFCGYSGEQPNQNTMRKHWNRLKKERGLSGTPYSLRHTFISIVSSQTGLAEGTIKDLVGHSESMQTFDVYKHRVDNELESAAEVINLTFERLKTESL